MSSVPVQVKQEAWHTTQDPLTSEDPVGQLQAPPVKTLGLTQVKHPVTKVLLQVAQLVWQILNIVRLSVYLAKIVNFNIV